MDKEWVRGRDDYIRILRDAVDHEQDKAPMSSSILKDSDKDACWSSGDIGAMGTKVYQLEVHGFVERVYDSSNHTDYALTDRDEIAKFVSEEEDYTQMDGMRVVEHDIPSPEDLPDGLFDDVIGYDNVKWLIKRALTTEDITNVLLVGPPGSAKTVFLLCIESMPDSVFVSGKSTSGPGVLAKMFREEPKYMAIDEFDDVDKEVQETLSQHMDTGILDETKVGKDRQVKMNTSTFASANSTDPIINQVQDRFLDLHFDPYTEEEFIEICEHLLPRREGVSEAESRDIADAVWKLEDEGNVRKAISVARLSRGDPHKVIEVLDEYSPSSVF